MASLRPLKNESEMPVFDYKENVPNQTHGVNVPTTPTMITPKTGEKRRIYNERFDSNDRGQTVGLCGTNSLTYGTSSAEGLSLNYRNLSENKKLALLCCALAFFNCGVGYSILAPFFPKEARKKDMPLPLTSFVFSVLELVSLIVSPVIGSNLTKFGPKFLCVSGIFVGGVCTILFGLLDRCPPGAVFIVITFLCRIIGAVGYAANMTSAIAILSSEFPKYIASCIALLTSTFGVGMLLGPAIGGFLFELGGFGLPFFVVGTTYLAVGIFIYFSISVPSCTAEDDKVSVLLLMQSPTVLIAMLSVVTSAMGLSFLDPTLTNHLDPFHLNIVYIGLIFTVPSVTYTLTAPLLGLLSDKKLIFKPPIVLGYFLLGLGYFMIGPSRALPFLPFKLWTVIVGLVLVGMSFNCLMVPAVKCMTVGAVELGLEGNLGLYAVLGGIINSMYSTGAFVGPMCAGVLAQFLGYSVAYTVMGLWGFFLGIVTFIVFSIPCLRQIIKF